MTQNREKPSASSTTERTTRRGLGGPSQAGDERSASGAFPRSWPELPGIEDTADDASQIDVARSAALRGASAPEMRPQSRGPEYHPPSVPGGSRERGGGGRGASGTFRMGTPASVQVRPSPDSEDPAPSTVPPGERAPHGGARPRRKLGRARFLTSAALGLALGSALALGVIRVPVRALGVLHATHVPESLLAPVAGRVVQVQAVPGQEVEPGSALVSLHAPELQQRLDVRRAELEALREEVESALREERAVEAQAALAIERRRKLLAERLELKETELAQRSALVQGLATLAAEEPNAAALSSARAAVLTATEARLGILDELSRLELELSDRKSERQTRARERRARRVAAEARARQAEEALEVTTLRAPSSGWVEAVFVSPGSHVQPGAPLLRLVPRAAPRSVAALIAAEDAAHVTPGAEASVELLPEGRTSGALAARVRHVSREVARSERVQLLLGAPSRDSWVELELELLDPGELAQEGTLRTGWRALVHLPAPRRRLGQVLYTQLKDRLTLSEWR